MTSEHLSRQAIERYVSRRAPVDEILSSAEHLDVCFDCRDAAAAIVDDGSTEIPHVRKRMTTFVRRQASSAYVLWVLAALVATIVMGFVLLLQK